MFSGLSSWPLLTASAPAGSFYLLLSILSSLVIALLLKYNEVRGGSRLVLIASNYIMAAGASLVHGGSPPPPRPTAGPWGWASPAAWPSSAPSCS